MQVPITKALVYLMNPTWHLLLNIVVWPWFAWLYLRNMPIDISRAREGLKVGTFWTIATIVIDLVGWVLIPHIWAMIFKEFYVDYQSWITLIYLIIFASLIMVTPLIKRA